MAGKIKSALILGATRGIGKQIALTFAENGYKVCVAAKTTESTPKLPGESIVSRVLLFFVPLLFTGGQVASLFSNR